MATTQGYGVQVMPSIQFADGAQLAGRGPGEAIAGFNSGIGAINAIQNTRQKAILAPIEQEAARARLAQIQAETDLAQANAPYRSALARIEMAKASIPIRQKTGEKIIGVNEIGADGQPTGRTHQVIQEEGFEFDPQTGARTPYSAMAKPLVTADTGALNNSLIDSRKAAADARDALNEIRRQDAETKKAAQLAAAQHYQDQFTLGTDRNKISQQRADTPNFLPVQGIGSDGNLTLLPFNRKSGGTEGAINTGVKPNRSEDPLFSPRPGDPTAITKAKPVSGFTTAANWVKGLLSPTPTEQPVTTLPNIPLTTAPVGQASANPGPPDASDDALINYLFDTSPPVQPISNTAIPVNKYQVRVTKP